MAMLLASSSRLRPASVSAEAGAVGKRREPGEFELLARHGHRGGDARLRAAEQRAGRDILQDGHPRKRLHDLEGAGEPAARRLERALRRHVLALKPDAAGGRPMHAGHQIDQRGLAGAVRADQRDDLALLQREAQVVDGRMPPKCRLTRSATRMVAHAAAFVRPNSLAEARLAIRGRTAPSRPPGRKKIRMTMTAPRMARL